jgi:hypothetical protein
MDVERVVLAIRASTTAITGTISATSTAMTSAITAAIKGAEAATNTAITRSSQHVAESVVRTQEVSDRYKSEERFRVTDPCSVAAATVGMTDVRSIGAGAAAANSGIGHGGSGGGAAPGASGSMDRALRIANGKEPAPAPEVQAQIAAKGACETFAGSGVRGTACGSAGFAASNTSGYQDADLKAATLLDGPQAAGSARRRLTIDPGTKDATAVSAFMRNVSSPLQLRDLTPGELKTDEGRRYMALKDAFDARISLAERPMQRHSGKILASTATIPMINELLKSKQAQFVTAYLNRQAPNWRTRGISEDELMNLEVERRHTNLQWQADVAESSPEEAAREMVRLQALQLVMLSNLTTEVREMSVAMSGLALAQARAELVPQLMAQHRLAAR